MLKFGETKTTYGTGDVGVSTNDLIRLYPTDKLDIAWRIIIEKYKNTISIYDLALGDSGVSRGIAPVMGRVYGALQTFPATWGGATLDGAILSTSVTDSNSILGKRLYGCEFKTDTVILDGYSGDPLAPGTVSRRSQTDTAFVPNNSWIEQTVTFVLKKGALTDTYIFQDTTQVKHWLFINGAYSSTGASQYNLIDTNRNNLCEKISAEGTVANAVAIFAVDAFPNPFNPATILRVSVPANMEGKDLALHIYNVRGQLVRTLLKSSVTRAGFTKKVVWEGDNNTGNKVSSGLYYYRLTVGNKVLKGSIVMAK